MADIQDEVEELAEMVKKGLISEGDLEELYLRDGDGDGDGASDDDDFVDQQLKEQRKLNAQLKKMEKDMRGSASNSQSSPSRKAVSKTTVGGARRSSVRDTSLSHTPAEMRKIERENRVLLGKLNNIHRKGAPTNSWQQPTSCRHISSSSRQRLESQRRIEGQNLQFVRKLQSVKSTMDPSTRSTAVVRSPRRHNPPNKAKPKKRPEWVDVAGVGLM